MPWVMGKIKISFLGKIQIYLRDNQLLKKLHFRDEGSDAGA